jgi:hypothetical protein
MEIARDENVAGEQEIKVLGHRSCERVLNGNDGDRNFAAIQQIENFNGAGTRNDGATFYHTPGGFVAERSRLSLDGNFHSSNLAGRLHGKQILLEQQGV